MNFLKNPGITFVVTPREEEETQIPFYYSFRRVIEGLKAYGFGGFSNPVARVLGGLKLPGEVCHCCFKLEGFGTKLTQVNGRPNREARLKGILGAQKHKGGFYEIFSPLLG